MKERAQVTALERRAGDNAGAAGTAPFVDPGRDAREPWPAIIIMERLAGMHFRDVGRRMQVIAVLEE
jgi:hypothetical protein